MTLVYLPDSAPGPEPATLAPSPMTLAGLRIAVLDNGKANADVVMTRAAETLAGRTGAVVSLVTKKGPRGESANAAVPCAPDIFELVLAQADLVITGAADCGSCTAYSVTDAIEFEKAGRPAVVVTTTKFEVDRDDPRGELRTPRDARARPAPPDRRHRRRDAPRLGRRGGRPAHRAVHDRRVSPAPRARATRWRARLTNTRRCTGTSAFQ